MKNIPAEFLELIRSNFDGPLANLGFARCESDSNEESGKQCYRAECRYLKFAISLDPRDAPNFCSLVLGEGSLDWPERDWNAVALWRIAESANPLLGKAGIYPLDKSTTSLEPLVARMFNELFALASDFLSGDLASFRKVRAGQTREREPYKIHSPNPQGGYKIEIDEESAKLKERFSRE